MEGDGITESIFKHDFQEDAERLLDLLVGYFGLDCASAHPPLRAIPRHGAIMKFLEAWDIRPTYEEQIEATVARMMASGATNEAALREQAIEVVR